MNYIKSIASKVVLLLMLMSANLFGQNNLVLHTDAVDSLLEWMQQGFDKNKIDNLLDYPAHQFMEQILRSIEGDDVPTFKEVLHIFAVNDSLSGDIYILHTAYKRQEEIAKLLAEIKSIDISGNSFERVLRYFPENYTSPSIYDIFFTLVGWHWGDAMMFHYVYEDGKYSISNDGKTAIMFNLTLAVDFYGDNTLDQINQLGNVLAHELFHVIFSDYTKDNWSDWDNSNIKNFMLWIMLNEGIAHYIADRDFFWVNYDKDDGLKQREQQAFESLSNSVRIIFNSEYSDDERRNTTMSGLHGGFWDKFIANVGMLMAFHIERYYGVEGLQESIKNGPLYFVKKYESVRLGNPQLPEMPSEIIEYVK
jgi:hypothetical protein